MFLHPPWPFGKQVRFVYALRLVPAEVPLRSRYINSSGQQSSEGPTSLGITHRPVPGFSQGEEGDGNTQDTPRKQLRSERIADLIDGHRRMSWVGETESGLYPAQVSGTSGSQSPDIWPLDCSPLSGLNQPLPKHRKPWVGESDTPD